MAFSLAFSKQLRQIYFSEREKLKDSIEGSAYQCKSMQLFCKTINSY